MAATSKSVELGAPAPDFILADASGARVALRDHRGSAGTLVAFICNHCPYVIHMRDALVRYARDFAPRGIQVIAINPNDALAYPDEAPKKIAEVAATLGFPYLIDDDQQVAIAYDAACTPDLYLYDAQLRLVYHGQFDATRPGGGTPAHGRDLRDATDLMLARRPVPRQVPSIGCSIKWKPGRAPAA